MYNMKKILFSIGMSLMLGLVACGGGNVDSKIEHVGQLAKEANEIKAQIAEGDNSNSQRLTEISVEMAKIASELEKENLTQEQREKLTKAALVME